MRIVLLAAVLGLGAGAACSQSEQPKAGERLESRVALISVADVDKQLASGGCIPVDANGDRTRKKMGVVPGAVLLSDYETFSLSELPTDKSRPLVFYCTNTYCTASHDAAARALSAGYTNVKVMDAGIAGWVKAGKTVQTL